MKRIKILLISLLTLFNFNIDVFAASASLSTSASSVYVGDSFKVTVNVNGAAAWNVHTTATGPVSGCVVNQADATEDAMNANKTFTATCTATGEGTITINLSGDITDENVNNTAISGTRTVTVTKKPTTNNNNNNSNNNNSNNNNSSNNNSSNNNTNTGGGSNNNNYTSPKSTNNKIKELSIEGYDLVKENDNNYSLTVPTDVTSVNIKANAEDSKAKITGIGNHNINVGDNNIEVIVTSESGAENKINIKVTRNDAYYLEDLEKVLENDELDEINIKVSSDTIVSKEEINKIKESNKLVNLNYNVDNKLMYSWIIDGSKITNTNDLLTTISYNSSNKEDMLRLSNYADGLYINAEGSNNAPNGTKIKLYVGDKYSDNDMVNIYSYSKTNDKLNLVIKNIKVEDGYITFNTTTTGDYLVTMSNILNNESVSNDNSSSNYLFIVIGILLLLIILLIILFILKKKKRGN